MIADPDNPVVKLCAEGIQAEFAGRLGEALRLYTRAWDLRQDDYDASVAAHYLARCQDNPGDVLQWNQLAYRHAEAVEDGRVEGFYPSLLLNLGWSYENLGDRIAARRYYELAAGKVQELPDGPYRETVAQGIANGLARTAVEG